MANIGKLIVFEGADGVGKSTLIKHTEELLKTEGVSFESHSFPGKEMGTLGWVVDQIQHDRHSFGLGGLTPLSLQALHIAAHLDHIEMRVLPNLRRGVWIVLDRFWWSTSIYGQADNVSKEVLETLIHAEKQAWGSTTPSMLFLVSRTSSFRPEHSEEKHSVLSALYTSLAKDESQKYPVSIISNDAIDESCESIRNALRELGMPSSGCENSTDIL
jgi:thymidylate kinase